MNCNLTEQVLTYLTWDMLMNYFNQLLCWWKSYLKLTDCNICSNAVKCCIWTMADTCSCAEDISMPNVRQDFLGSYWCILKEQDSSQPSFSYPSSPFCWQRINYFYETIQPILKYLCFSRFLILLISVGRSLKSSWDFLILKSCWKANILRIHHSLHSGCNI